MITIKRHTNLSLGYFILAAILGVVLRSFRFAELPINYKFFVHTHSHIALLGWVYVAMTTILYKVYLSDRELARKYRRLFWVTQFTLVGMLLSFPWQGYALFSILFSTLFLFASYRFAWFFMRHVTVLQKRTNSYTCIKFALWYMVISSIGPWALGAIMNTLGPTSVWYRMAIYFYLHFQYNGWMILAMVGLLIYVLENNSVPIPRRNFRLFFWSLNFGIALTFFLSTLWVKPPFIFNIIGGIGALLQLLAFLIFLKIVLKGKYKLKSVLSIFQMRLLKTLVVLLGVKIGLQILTSIPYFAHLAASILDFTIGYLHWTFLGVISLSLFFFLDYFKLMRFPKLAYSLYFFGFLITESLIFYKAIVQWLNLPHFELHFEVLAIFSALIPLGLIYLWSANTWMKSLK